MILLETTIVAFSMFSAIPMPKIEWNARNMKYALVAFPLIGAVIGLALWGISALLSLIQAPPILCGALYCIVPVLITGGIHIDGFADTLDALASHAEPEKKQEILKDPHVGSFAVIRLCCYFILNFAIWSVLPEFRVLPLLLAFVLSRTLSGFAVASFPLAKNTGLAHTFATSADRKRVSLILAVAAVALSVVLCIFCPGGILITAVIWVIFRYYYSMSRKQFGGLSGDLAGWFLVRAEEGALIALLIFEYMEVLLA